MFAAAGWPVSSPLDLPTETFNPADVIHRRIPGERLKGDDLFCLVLDCGDCGDNLVTTWIVEPVSTRVQRGGVVLHRWAKHHDASISGLRELDDGMITDRSFDQQSGHVEHA